MSFVNLSFEEAEDEHGCAVGWTFACHGHREYAAFSGMSWEGFEAGWLEAFKTSFVGLGADLERALFDQSERPLEDFEHEWAGIEVYFYDILGVAALFDGATEAAEDFESEWDSNEDYLFAFVGVGTDLELAAFDGTPENFEDFEEDWVASYKTDFVGVGTDLTAAAFDVTPENFEDFEEDWTLTMVSI